MCLPFRSTYNTTSNNNNHHHPFYIVPLPYALCKPTACSFIFCCSRYQRKFHQPTGPPAVPPANQISDVLGKWRPLDRCGGGSIQSDTCELHGCSWLWVGKQCRLERLSNRYTALQLAHVIACITDLQHVDCTDSEDLPRLWCTRCSAIAERPHCRVHYSFCQKCKTGTGRQYFTDIIGLPSTTVI